MKSIFAKLSVILFFGLTSCIEIIDDISFNSDGSGTFKYNINLSSSRVKINSILALDSLDGKKVPSLDDIKNKLNEIRDQIITQKGLSNVQFEANYTDFIFKISCDFDSFENLQKAVALIAKSENKGEAIPELDENWLVFEKEKLVRSIPQITIKKTSQINKTDSELLRNGSYTSITRFEDEVKTFDNTSGLLSKNKKAVMLKTDPYSLTQNPRLLDNTIYLVKSE